MSVAGGDSPDGFRPRDTLETVMLSPCVGGLLRTWGDKGSRLWGVADPSSLTSSMGRGLIGRTLREEDRYREVALLHEPSGRLVLHPRFPMARTDRQLEFEAREVQLTEPGPPSASTIPDLKELLGQAVRHTVEVDGLLLIELGGWDAPQEPYCLFLVTHDQGELSVVETAPPPNGATLWQQHIRPGEAGATVAAPATDGAIAGASLFMIDAALTWGRDPWDLAITYGTKSR